MISRNTFNRIIAVTLCVALVFGFTPSDGLAEIHEEALSPGDAVLLADWAEDSCMDDYDEDEEDVPDTEIVELDDEIVMDDGSTTASIEAVGDDLSIEAESLPTGESIVLLAKDAAEDEGLVAIDDSVVSIDDDSVAIFDFPDDECFRERHVIQSRDSCHAFHYSVDLEPGQHLELSEEGGIDVVFVEEDGEEYIVSCFEAPWAVDAAGNRVATRFALEEDGFVQIVDSGDAVYPIVSDPAWFAPAVLVAVRVGGKIVLKYGSKVFKRGFKAAAKNRVTRALDGYKAKSFKAGTTSVRLTKERMQHILVRHHPKYWDGELTTPNTFFHPSTKIQDVENMVKIAIRQHQRQIVKLKYDPINPKNGETGIYYGAANGVKYKLVVRNNRVVQFYPRE